MDYKPVFDLCQEYEGAGLDYSATMGYIVQISIGGTRRNREGRTYVYNELDQ